MSVGRFACSSRRECKLFLQRRHYFTPCPLNCMGGDVCILRGEKSQAAGWSCSLRVDNLKGGCMWEEFNADCTASVGRTGLGTIIEGISLTPEAATPFGSHRLK